MIPLSNIVRADRLRDTAPTIVYRSNGTDNSSQTTYSFASRAIGTAASDRYVYVATCTRNIPVVTGCTIAGNAATELARFETGGTAGQRVVFWGLNVTTGTTATIAYTLDAADSDGSIVVWSGTGLTNPLEPFSTFNMSFTGAPAVFSGSIWAPRNTVVLAVRQSQVTAGTPSCTWTGLSEDLDAPYESNLQHTGAASTTVTDFGVGIEFSSNTLGTLGNSRMSAIVLY
jgi:hypothetical protein